VTDVELAQLWAVMLATYGHRWESAYGRHPVGVTAATWDTALADLHPTEIADGARQCLTFGDGWPPTLPEFRALCLGIPSLAEARADMSTSDTERRPFTRLLWQHLDGWAFGRADTDRAERMFRDAYELARSQRLAGAQLPAPSRYLEQAGRQPVVPATREQVGRHMDEIAEALGIMADDTDTTPRAPAHLPDHYARADSAGIARDSTEEPTR
jgi:hypothetical protein